MFCIAKENRPLCTACTACAHICPQDCIKMEADKNGFLYPVINEDDCLNCGLCFTVCPENNHETLNRRHIPSTCFAARHMDKKILMQSSSGGAFTAIIQCFDDDTYVFGACYDENMHVVHRGATGKDGYKPFQKAKYVQSDLQNSYRDIELLLKNGKKVIFSGTPCQIAGLRCYLRDSDEGLICIELLCHGVASPRVFNDYIKYLEDKFHSKVASFIFRDKHPGRGMWRDFLTKIQFENGQRIFDGDNLYVRGFLDSLFVRESCLTCPYACPERIGDIVIGDFWGLEKYKPDLVSDTGVSVVIPITRIGRNVVEQLSQKMYMEEVPIKYALDGNPVLLRPARANPLREKFFELYKKNTIYEAISACIQRPSLSRRIASRLPESLKLILRKLRKLKP